MLRRSTAVSLTLLLLLTGLSGRICRVGACAMVATAAAATAPLEPGDEAAAPPCHASGLATGEAPQGRAKDPGASGRATPDCCASAEAGLVADAGCAAAALVSFGAVGDSLPSWTPSDPVLASPHQVLAAPAARPPGPPGLRPAGDPPSPPFTLIAQHTLLLR